MPSDNHRLLKSPALAALPQGGPVAGGDGGKGNVLTLVPKPSKSRASNMKNFIVAALAALVATVASAANARDDEPSWKAVEEYASNYMQQLKEQNMSERETANQLASSIWWSEKLQLLCPSYFYVNARRARYDYLLRQGTWNMMFGPGKTATSILNERPTKRTIQQCSRSRKGGMV